MKDVAKTGNSPVILPDAIFATYPHRQGSSAGLIHTRSVLMVHLFQHHELSGLRAAMLAAESVQYYTISQSTELSIGHM